MLILGSKDKADLGNRITSYDDFSPQFVDPRQTISASFLRARASI